ncbi:hypothetical protein SLH46_08145 [Draconibacterium sp. IB214405]|uniref:hypothetical protein n=1 Tax=Draconibacterium sp. IB214405 TaxID=3097352 RepID=UPI002A13F349|nr:hypothetical protein [Draconibacterium sp. IB214405]MDX8339145.1 hypothetical protein [Draconibacterium sp. IB214405]
MKQIFAILIVGLLILSQSSANAQNNNNEQDRWERYRTEKVSFLTTKLDLTPEEAQKFWPVYNQMEKERSETQRKKHDLEAQVRDAEGNLSNKEMIKLTREHVQLGIDEANLAEKYNEEYLKILPPVKVIKLYNAENEFRIHMFRKFRDRNRNDNES